MAASVRDVAAAAGVSVGTVSNVLNRPHKVSADTVERVTQAIERLGFVRNDAARQLRVGRSRSIGLIVLDTANPFFAAVARGAEARADEAGMSVLLGNADEDAEREGRYLELFREQRVNGVLITPTTEDVARLARLRDAGTPVVLVDREMPGAGFDSVSVDDVEGGYVAAAHLLAGGRRRIAFIAGPLSIRQVSDRLEGARRAVEETPGATIEVWECPSLTVLAGRSAATSLLERRPSERPDAVFAANDLLAVGAIQALAIMAGVRIPDDIAVIGYDDIDFAAATVVPLSSVRQPASVIGYTAVDLLLAQLEDPQGVRERNVRFRPELVVRASTGG
ncbi:LacI family transcriptional regulator [Microbacterium sp. LRZ72]|uniref:LacI family DNA-binding transcriptional regulator n=1 Tax=Microbacterium sp. LRZ72 TaxID=2942481 RepID=UPI0029BB603E|nr:LacI family DNA-binding transcriptional regulator [Microbacterium sp. LRZ72]MDX2376478.1 LacI family transcriptional regulator [Microbacterium sp. LRZ72]